MTLKEIWYSDDYKKLREEYEGRLLFITFGGSYAYGTNVETSDIDIRGVMLPTTEELIGLNNFEQRVDENTDTVIYEFNKFIKLISNCNPNTIELLGCREYLIFNPLGEELINNVKMFLSKRCINTFAGYANAQLRRLTNALCHDNYTQEDKAKHIKSTMEVAMQKLQDKNQIYFENGIEVKNINDEIKLSINIQDKPIDEVRAALNDLLTIEKTFNKLNARNRKKDDIHLQKHMMHLIRLYLMVFDILEKHEVKTYREDREFLLEVRNGKYFNDKGEIIPEFYEYLNSLEERLQKAKAETTLPEKPNFKEIQNFVIRVNKAVINNEVKPYKEPLYEVIV